MPMEERVKEIAKSLKSPNFNDRLNAVRLLGQPEFKPQHVIPPLVRALKDEHPGVRKTAAEALGNWKHPDAIPHLLKSIRDEHEAVRSQSSQALIKIGQAIQGKRVEGAAKTIQLIAPYLYPEDHPLLVYSSYHAFRKGGEQYKTLGGVAWRVRANIKTNRIFTRNPKDIKPNWWKKAKGVGEGVKKSALTGL